MAAKTKARRNPVVAGVLDSFAGFDPLLLQELERGETHYEFEGVARRLSEWTGQSLQSIRAYGLQRTADHLPAFNNPGAAMRWISNHHFRLTLWILLSLYKRAAASYPALKDSIKQAEKMFVTLSGDSSGVWGAVSKLKGGTVISSLAAGVAFLCDAIVRGSKPDALAAWRTILFFFDAKSKMTERQFDEQIFHWMKEATYSLPEFIERV